MARRLIVVLAGTVAGALAVPAVSSAAGFKSRDADQRYVPGEALVRYERGTDAGERRELRGAADVEFENSVSLPRTQVVSFDGPVRAAIERLEDQPGVVDAQPNYLYHALAAAPNDTHFGHLWGLGSTPGVGVLPAWDRSRGAGQVIAIVDTGVDLTHPDLAGNLWTMPGQPGVHGYDFVDNDNQPDDFNLHGTHVAGTAAATADNGQGVAGVAPQAQIMAVRVLDGDGSGSTTAIVNGIVFAANQGAGVINLSLGGPAGAGDQAMSDAIGLADQRNAVVVAAAGNGGDDGVGDNNDATPTTPCTLSNPNLICVAALTRTGGRSSFSNFGATTVDVGAPGGDGSGDPDADVLSAKPSWALRFGEDFDGGLGTVWSPTGAWGTEGGAATDSPSALYQANTHSMLQKATPVDLNGQRGCTLDYLVALESIQAGDAAGVGVFSGLVDIGQDFSGDSGGFFRVEMSISAVDGRGDVQPTFLFDSDAAGQGDGAYIDDFNQLCRGQFYDDLIRADNAAAGGSYTAIAGTSMASPHVAGVAALVRAVDPGAPPSQVVQALRNGAKPVPAMAGVTVSGGAVDAVGAMDAALALPNPVPALPPPPAPPPPPSPLAKARFGRVSVNNRGVVTLRLFGTPGASGVLTLSANLTRPSAARVVRVARKAFRIGSTGRATVKPRLSRAALRQLRRAHRLRLRAKVVLKNAAGQTSTAGATIRLTLRRR
jgi:thermitase